MHLTFPEVKAAGLVVRSSAEGKTLSLWHGDSELIAELSHDQARTIARALTKQGGITQLVGHVREFQVRHTN